LEHLYFQTLCGSCGSHHCALKTLPSVFIFHLNRIEKDKNGIKGKLNHPVVLCRALDLSGLLPATQEAFRYKLVSVISHIGSGTDDGHFLSEILLDFGSALRRFRFSGLFDAMSRKMSWYVADHRRERRG
ncbi:unnamed protein product, partial [Gadus morhua 'NCC']